MNFYVSAWENPAFAKASTVWYSKEAIRKIINLGNSSGQVVGDATEV